MILLLRVDPKLVRCAKDISAVNGADRVVAIDDPIASNPMLRDTEIMSAPITCKARVYGVEESVDHLRKSLKNVFKTIVVVKDPAVYITLFEQLPELPKEVNFAKQPKKEDTKTVEVIRKLTDMGINVYFQSFLLGDKVTWDSVKDQY